MRTKNREKGASAVELAMVLPLLMMVLFGIIEFGCILYDKAVITNASREAARKGIVFHQSCEWSAVEAEMIKAANNYGTTHLVSFGGGYSAPTVSVAGNCCTAGSNLTVTVNYPYTFLVLPNFAKSLTGELVLSGVTVMNCENQ